MQLLTQVNCLTLVRCFEVTVLDRETLKAPFAYVTWGMANPGEWSAAMHKVSSDSTLL